MPTFLVPQLTQSALKRIAPQFGAEVHPTLNKLPGVFVLYVETPGGFHLMATGRDRKRYVVFECGNRHAMNWLHEIAHHLNLPIWHSTSPEWHRFFGDRS